MAGLTEKEKLKIHGFGNVSKFGDKRRNQIKSSKPGNSVEELTRFVKENMVSLGSLDVKVFATHKETKKWRRKRKK